MKKLKILTVFAVVFMIMFTYMTPGVSASKTKRVIHIVYDDTSGIYYGDDGEFTDKWSQIKNAVQSFVSLTNEGDKIVIYPISGKGAGIVFENNSNVSEIIADIDNSLKGYSINRSFSVVTSAWNDLKKESNIYEKWLVLICDGKFEEYKDENSDNSIQEKLVSYASDGIRVISQAISNNGAIYNLKNDENFYCYNVSSAKEILQKTIEISNLIYKRSILTEEYYEYNSKSNTLTIKDTGLPISEMIFVVSDPAASISGKLGNTGNTGAVFIKNPSGRPKAFDDSENKLKVASGLEKKVYTYRFSNALQPGEYELKMSGRDDILVLYKADFNVELQLSADGTEIEDKKSISTGKYDYKVVALNPETKDVIKSPMLDGAVYSIKTEGQQNNVSTLDKKEGEISFLKGNTRVETVIELGTQKFSVSEVFYVFGEVDFHISGLGEYKVKDLDSAKPIKVTVRTESLPENVFLDCKSDKNIKFRVEKTSDDNEFLIYLQHADDDSYLFTSTGKIDVVFTVSVNEGGEILTFSKPGSIVIENEKAINRVIDWIWYYKWFLLIAITAIILFLVFFNIKAKKIKKEEVEEETVLDEIIDETEREE